MLPGNAWVGLSRYMQILCADVCLGGCVSTFHNKSTECQSFDNL